MISYTPLHVHTEKSLMDGVATADEYARRAIENEMTSVAVTDHGTLSYHRTFDRVMRQNHIKPIFGMEAYICPDISDRREKSQRANPLDRNYFHLTILAKNAAGYKNLSKLNELSWGEGFFYKPRIDFSMLDKYRDGLIFGSACMSGLINSAIEIGEFAKAKEHLATLRDLAGDDFYIEIMPHNVDGINAQLYTMADEFRIKTIVTPDCHHAHVGQKVIQEIMLIANTHPSLITPEQRAAMPKIDYLSDERLSVEDATALGQLDNLYGSDRKMTFNKFDIHLLNAEEMWRNLGIDARWDSFENTLLVDSLIENIELPTNQDLLPVSFKNPNAELRKRCTKFLDDGGYSREYYDRLDEELAIVGDKGFDAYFLIVADAVQWARSNGITVGPGRGSGVSSLINYALGNTTVDPVKHGLLFFRFIDPSRSDWPDVDVDFEDRRRDEVKAYVSERYGQECVASIATYQKFQDKGVVKDVARVFSVPLGEVTKATKLIEFWDEYKTSPALQKFRDKYPQIERYGDQLRGRTRGTGMHASGMVTSRIPLSDIAPMETRSVKGSDIRVPVVAADMDETADIGLIKFDWLGLKALSTVRDTLELIYKRYKKKIKLYEIDYDDANVYRMLTAGHTSGVFQCEQAPYTKLLTVLGIDKFDELAATNALVRPGAANTIGKEYVQRKQGHKRITYVHPIVKSFTEETYGLPIYQEQIMLLCTELAGMSMSEANQVRRITSKKKDPIALEQYKQVFVAGASDKIGSEIASALWEDILKWSGYGFNKSHAVAYSYISYWTAWLKHYYPLEFMASTLKNEGDKDSRTQYLIEARRLGIKVLLPHINSSDVDFTIEGDAIRIGLSAIKYVTAKPAQTYIDNRPFASYDEVKQLTMTKNNGLSSSALKAMDAVGALNIGEMRVTNEQIKANLYEYLNLPETAVSLPLHWPAYMTTADDFDDQGAYVMTGFVTNIKRGKGWSLITVMDRTGSFGVFHDENTTIVKGEQYLFLIGSNRIVEAIPLSEVKDSDSGLIKWLNLTDGPCATNEFFILSFNQRTTKQGKRMGSMIVSTYDRELLPMVVFATQFPTAWAKLRPGNAYHINYEEGRDGLVFKSVE